MDDGTRLNKYLASCGIGSRRACDTLVQEGHVEINGQPCLNPATKVATGDFVKVDGRRVSPKTTGVVMLNKPRGLVCTNEDELGRDTIFALLPGSLQHLNHVGRLDRETEGLLVLTNDGQLSQSLLHPSKHIEKEYIVTANQPVNDEHLGKFLKGIYTEGGRMSAKEVERLSPRRIRVVLITGHKRQIRLMFQSLGYTVQRLIRIRIGSFVLSDIPPGKWRHLEPKEIETLLVNPVDRKTRTKARRTDDRSAPPRKRATKTARKTAKKATKRTSGRNSTDKSPKSAKPDRNSSSRARKKPGRGRKF